ncbi:MAG: SDR family oxidoreductase [Chloroflexi bacterium]|nr:SDR family oxidoreductase [Chloroflexota bacterium]
MLSNHLIKRAVAQTPRFRLHCFHLNPTACSGDETLKLQNKVVLITGAASGIGRAAALLMADEGARIMVSDINAEGGAETVQRITARGGQAQFCRCDVAKAGEVQALVEATVAAFGQLNCAVNNAGVGGKLARTHEQTEDTWDLVMNVNLKGVWLCMKYEIPHLIEAGGGSIVNVASLAGLIGFPYGQIYGASKHGVLGLTKGAALEYARRGLRINAVCPGFTDTAMVAEMDSVASRQLQGSIAIHPMKRLGTAEEIAAAILWLCSDDASFVNGHALSVDGGAAIQ